MKKIITLCISLCASYYLSAQSVPNGSFETWNSNIWSDPNAYYTSNGDIFSRYQLVGSPLQTTDAYHGTYALKLATQVYKGDTLAAYITNAMDPSKGIGGVPYSQKPTGMRFYYKCNLATGDSATIFAAFKRAGSVIGVYRYKVTGSVSTYTLMSKTFSPALLYTPDTVIFAATSGIYNGVGQPKGKAGGSITMDSINFTGVSSQPAMLNGDFENWHSDTTYTAPGWDFLSPGAHRTSDAYMGTYALGLTTIGPNPNNNSPAAGVATTGMSSRKTGRLIGGYPFTHKTDTLVFYYKYIPAVSTDSAAVGMQFSKGGSPIGNYAKVLKGASTYTMMQIPVNLGTSPDTVIVFLTSSNDSTPSNACIGSYFVVDNIHFKSQPVAGTMDIKLADQKLFVYPNPVMGGQFTIELKGTNYTDNARVQVVNILGQIVDEQIVGIANGNIHATVSSTNLGTGVYLVRVLTGTDTFIQKIVIGK